MANNSPQKGQYMSIDSYTEKDTAQQQHPRNKCLACLKRLLLPRTLDPCHAGTVLSLFLNMFGSGIAGTSVFSYLPRLTKDFGIDDVDIGRYAGIIASLIFLGQSIGSYFWGTLSDRYGRKVIIIISNLLFGIFTLLFGFNLSFRFVATMRFMQGLVNGIVGNAKAAAGDISDETNQGAMMGIVLVSFNMGLVLGPAMGGFLSLPHEKYPAIFSEDSLFGKFPYLLPNLLNFCVIILSTCVTYFFMNETLKRRVSKQTEKDLLIDLRDTSINNKTTLSYTNESENTSNHQQQKQVKSVSGYRCLRAFSNFVFGSKRKVSIIQLLKIRELRLVSFLYGIFAFCANGFNELVPVFAAVPRTNHGLSFTTSEIGMLLLGQSFPGIMGTLLIGPKLEVRIGSRKVVMIASYLFMFFIVMVPCISALTDRAAMWTCAIITTSFLRISNGFGSLAINVMINNSVEPQLAGAANGFGYAFSNFFRTFCPILMGSVYSWSLDNNQLSFPFNYYFSFLLLSLLTFVSLSLLVMLPKSIDKRKVVPLTTEQGGKCYNRV